MLWVTDISIEWYCVDDWYYWLIIFTVSYYGLRSNRVTLEWSDRYLVLPSCDVPKAPSTEALLQLPQTAAVLRLLLQGDAAHALLVSAASLQETRDIDARLQEKPTSVADEKTNQMENKETATIINASLSQCKKVDFRQQPNTN